MLIIKINFTECVNDNGALFRDLSNYKTVDKWMRAVVNEEVSFGALDVGIKFNGKWYYIRQNGCITSDAENILKKLVRLNKHQRTIPNDVMSINADDFERELFINLDGE